MDIGCDGTTAYFGDTATHTQVEVFSIGSTGELKELNNFTNKNGESSNNVMLSLDGTHLYVSNTMSNQITTLSVGSNGALTYDSTLKLNKPGLYALGLATGTGLNLFVSEENNPESIGVLAAVGGVLKEVHRLAISCDQEWLRSGGADRSAKVLQLTTDSELSPAQISST